MCFLKSTTLLRLYVYLEFFLNNKLLLVFLVLLAFVITLCFVTWEVSFVGRERDSLSGLSGFRRRRQPLPRDPSRS